MPAVRPIALWYVVAVAQRGRAVDADAVVVVEEDQLVEAQVPGERARFVADALLEVAVAHDRVDPVVEDWVVGPVESRGHVGLPQGKPDRVCLALAQRARCDLDARRQPVFRVTRRDAFELPELLDLVERHVVAGQEQQAVEQHRAVAGRQHEAIAVRPFGVGRVVTQVPRPQHLGHRRHAHRQPRVARVRFLHRVHCQAADHVGGLHVEAVEGLREISGYFSCACHHLLLAF